MQKTTDDVLGVQSTLPPERIEEVYDFALFLQQRSNGQVDSDDEWTEEDLRDAVAAGIRYAESLETGDEK